MKVSKLFMIALLAGTLGVLGCDTAESTGNDAGTGGTGGTGGNGDGGTGGGSASCGTEPAQVACCIDFCVGDDPVSEALFASCVATWNSCDGLPNEGECRVLALAQCTEVNP